MRFITVFCIISLLFNLKVFADESPQVKDLKLPTGGAVLEFPSGRQLLEEQPLFFKWVITKENIKTVTLKIFEELPDTKEPVLLFRSDFQAEVNSLRLSQLILNDGSYFWEIETYDDKNPSPITKDRTEFFVESSQILNLRTSRLFVLAAYGRGEYTSDDANYSLSFDTTPTIFGAGYAGGSQSSLYEISYTFSDLTIRGGVKKFQVGRASYSFRILGDSPYSFELFIGPQLRFLTFPLISSPDGTTIRDEHVNSLQGGFQISLQKQYNQQINFYTTLFVDNAFDAKNYLSDFSYEINFGTIYNLKWPLGIGMDFAYKSDNLTGTTNGLETSATSESVIARGKVFYSF